LAPWASVTFFVELFTTICSAKAPDHSDDAHGVSVVDANVTMLGNVSVVVAVELVTITKPPEQN
jgi:hypothetical protein